MPLLPAPGRPEQVKPTSSQQVAHRQVISEPLRKKPRRMTIDVACNGCRRKKAKVVVSYPRIHYSAHNQPSVMERDPDVADALSKTRSVVIRMKNPM